MRLPTSIRVRLLLALLAMLAIVALVMGGVTYRNVLVETETIFDYQLRQMALSLRDQGEIAPDQAAALNDEQLDLVVQIWSVDGRNIYATRAHTALPSRAMLGFADIEVEGQIWRTFSVATPARVIQVAQPRQIRRRLAADAAWHSVVPLLFLAPLLGLAGWWLSALTLAPLRRVAGQLRERRKLLEPLPARGLPDEIEPLVSALNGLLQRLGETMDHQRAFVSDAAHELRSPLTALKLQLETLKRAGDETQRQQAMNVLATGIERAARIVEQLLVLARSEPGAPAAPLEPIDLVELVRQAIADTVPYALSRGSEFELKSDGAVEVLGDKAALHLLVRNLVDNAVRHSPRGSRVDVGVHVEQQMPTLLIDDSGPGIPAEERDRVFDRFYRRADAEEAGSGLGLAIVRSVAMRHEADVSLEQSPLGGLRVIVRFPKPAF
jgi:two-component system OmpR family sensor kinase/two-component system sensor histidine kinase QseC